ncbi:hypothetical protein STCU_00821 [Strigomonas culicis]|uniref:BTB domain-containing protein n=1 Tax=Strigomonas culicis TaxID=28005 RepID=S9V504_9TRYP|nr:hypothetical protein STCU_00821 [Strigomonas culicis]|eukprot:EPY35968.1 hypothetical protein STCU_00821 [Strigomonas culicis]
MCSTVLAILETKSAQYKHQLVRLNIGGELFEVALSTLLAYDAPNLFHSLFSNEYLLCDYDEKTKSIFIDRDPATFRYIINYLRGYSYFQALGEEERTKLKVDAEYFCLKGLHDILTSESVDKASTRGEMGYFMKDAPGVSVDRKRFRVVYCVSTIGDVYFVAGKHTITFHVVRADYVGIGLVSDSCINRDQEYHRTANCCVYYMSGVFYTNFPHHRKEENLEKISDGDLITLTVDMDKGMAEYKLKSTTKMFSIGRIARLKFSVIMKFMSQVRIVSEPAAVV